ncbi:MAG TPA: hypothetical protein VFT09_06120 [Ilumatobacteraceae bacterium]|nr:hypothetical protein [Ilumatobacteraceae bacterium]
MTADSTALPPPDGTIAAADAASTREATARCVLCGALVGGFVCPRCSTDQRLASAQELRLVRARLDELERAILGLRHEVVDLEARRRDLERVLRRPTAAAAGPATRGDSPAPPERSELRPDRIRDILLWAGAVLVVVSAFSLAAVLLATGGGEGKPVVTPTRVAGVLVLLALVTAVLSWRVRSRLAATAEVLLVVAVGLLLAGWYLLRRGGSGEDISAETWWAGGFALAGLFSVAAGAAGYRAVRVLAAAFLAVAAAIVLASLPGPPWAVAMMAAGIASGFVVGAWAALRSTGWGAAAIAALTAAGAFVVTGVAVAAVDVAEATSTRSALGPATAMVALGMPPLAARVLLRRDLEPRAPLADLLVGLHTMSLIAAVTFVAVPRSSTAAVITVAAAAGLVAVVIGCLAQRQLGWGVALVGAAGVALGLGGAVRPLAIAVFAPLGWFGQPWTLDPRVRADLRLAPSGTVRIGDPWMALTAVGMGWFAVVVAAHVSRPARAWRDVAVGSSALTCAFVASLLPIAAHRDVTAAFGATLGTALALAVLAGRSMRRGRGSSALLVGAATAAIPAAGWSATNRWMTVGALCAVTVAMMWLARCAPTGSAQRRRAMAGAGAVAAGAVITACIAIGLDATTTAVVVAVVAGATLVAAASHAAATSDAWVLVPVAALALVAAALLAAQSARWLAIVLSLECLALAVASMRGVSPMPYRVAAVAVASGALVTWLAAAGVTVLEAYTVPLASVSLLGGAVLRRARHDVGSWVAYGPGLVLLLGPSLIATLADGPAARVVALAATALLIVAVGTKARLQAPIVLGVGTVLALAVDAGAPVADDVPRWIPIGAAGIACCGSVPRSSGGWRWSAEPVRRSTAWTDATDPRRAGPSTRPLRAPRSAPVPLPPAARWRGRRRTGRSRPDRAGRRPR